MKDLSILICSLNEREKMLNKLLDQLRKQKTSAVEILVEKDNGEMLIGDKRNIILKNSTGKYVAFTDDDDEVSDDYVSKILKGIEKEPDCCGLEGIVTTNGKRPKKFIHSLQYKKWFEKNGIYYRNPNHLNTIKRDIALKVGFTSKSHGEDRDFSMAVLPYLKTEEYISGPIYYYKYIKKDLTKRKNAHKRTG